MQRPYYLKQIQDRFCVNPVVALLGPRQCGKTTIANQFLKSSADSIYYFDLENPVHLAKLGEPMLALEALEGLIVIDEIQRHPELFPVLRVLIDQHKKRKFLILGSASRDLIAQSSETLAGRISYLECAPFRLSEIDKPEGILYRGGFPRSLLADNDEISFRWREDYISTFLERDIPNLGFRIPARTMRRFWMMLAHYHGQTFNASELGKSLGVAHTTIRHYLDILVSTFMIREVTPWIANLQKRQVKMPKIYFRDSGLFLTLLQVPNLNALLFHPKLGSVWEGFALEQVIGFHQTSSESCFYWGLHQQAELDLLLFDGGKQLGFEFKYQDAPTITKSMRIAMESLKLDMLYVICPGTTRYHLAEHIEVIGLEAYVTH
jgi:uncharacterized protein